MPVIHHQMLVYQVTVVHQVYQVTVVHQVYQVTVVHQVYQVTVVRQVYQVPYLGNAIGYAFRLMQALSVGENADLLKRSHQLECGQDVTRVVRRVTASEPCAWMRSSPM